jgi:hypothetical protein
VPGLSSPARFPYYHLSICYVARAHRPSARRWPGRRPRVVDGERTAQRGGCGKSHTVQLTGRCAHGGAPRRALSAGAGSGDRVRSETTEGRRRYGLASIATEEITCTYP